jgi:flagellar biogenesis protein FliO
MAALCHGEKRESTGEIEREGEEEKGRRCIDGAEGGNKSTKVLRMFFILLIALQLLFFMYYTVHLVIQSVSQSWYTVGTSSTISASDESVSYLEHW